MKKRIIGIFALIIISGIILTCIGTVSIISGWNNLRPQKSDCIIVLGCRVYGTVPSPFLVARLNEAIRLYNEGYGKFIIFSGGQGGNERISEAEAMKRYAVSKGMPPSVIIKEDKSTSTMTNLINSKKLMDSNNFKSAVIVSNKYHLKRASLMAKKLGISASYSGVFVKQYIGREISGFFREILAIVKFYIFG